MWIWVTTAVALWAVSPLRATPLDDYVHRKDPHYQYSEIGSYRGPEYTMYILNMTSQKWKTGRFRLFTKCIIFFFFKRRRLKCINQWMDTHSYYAVGNFLIRLCCKGDFVWGLFQIFGVGGMYGWDWLRWREDWGFYWRTYLTASQYHTMIQWISMLFK